MRDAQGQDIWFKGSYDERCATAAKHYLNADAESRFTINDIVNPEGTTVGSALESSPSASEPQNPVDAATETAHRRDLLRNAGRHRTTTAGEEADAFPLPTKHHAAPGSVWSNPSQPEGEAHQIVRTNACDSFKGASRASAESSSTRTSYAEACCSPDQELQAFSSRLQQALLQVKRHAEDGFLTAKAAVYGRLVEQINTEREKELQRLEEARQEAEGARNLLYSLRRSKEATEERLSRMFIFLRRQTLRQQARLQQQEALHRWKCFAVRRRHQRLKKSIVTAVSERVRTWRVFTPWRIAALQTASARRQQTAARQAQVAMDDQLRLAEACKAREEQLVRDLRQQLQAETALRLRLQENLRRIFLEGASAVCGSQDNSCADKGVEGRELRTAAHTSNLTRQHRPGGRIFLEEASAVCGSQDSSCTDKGVEGRELHTAAHTSNLTRQQRPNSPVDSTRVCSKVASNAKSTAGPKDIREICSRGTEESTEGVTAAVSRRRRNIHAKADVGAGAKRGLLVSGGVALRGQQRSTTITTKRPVTTLGYKTLHCAATSCGPAAEGAHPSHPSVLTEQAVNCAHVRSPQIQRCLSESKSLEVVGQMVVPTSLRDLLPAVARELPSTSPAPPATAGLSSSFEAISPLSARARWCNGGTLDGLHSHVCDTGSPAKRECGHLERSCAYHRSIPVKVSNHKSSTIRHRPVHPATVPHLEGSTLETSTAVRVTDRASCGPRADYYINNPKINRSSLPSDHRSVGYAADKPQRSKPCMGSDVIGTKSVQYYTGKCHKTPEGRLRSTVTYPGGVEANRAYPYSAVCHELLSSQDSVRFEGGRMDLTHPHIAYVWQGIRPAVGTFAGRLQGRKDSNWTQSF